MLFLMSMVIQRDDKTTTTTTITITTTKIFLIRKAVMKAIRIRVEAFCDCRHDRRQPPPLCRSLCCPRLFCFRKSYSTEQLHHSYPALLHANKGAIVLQEKGKVRPSIPFAFAFELVDGHCASCRMNCVPNVEQ